MVQMPDAKLRKTLRNSDAQVMSVMCECLYNVIIGNVKVQIKNLKRFVNVLKIVLQKKTSQNNVLCY